MFDVALTHPHLAVSGKVDVVNLVLEAGVKTDLTNSVNRTAAQMAAFVGQHQCVRAINNFFPRQELQRFTVPRGGCVCGGCVWLFLDLSVCLSVCVCLCLSVCLSV